MAKLEKIPSLVAENQIDKAIQLLANAAISNPELLNDALHLQGRWVDYNARRMRGELTFEEENRQYSKVLAALLELTERVKQQGKHTAISTLTNATPYSRSTPVLLLLFFLVGMASLYFYFRTSSSGAFEFTINLKPNPDSPISPTYPSLKNAKLILHLANEFKPAEVKSLGKYTGEADFKNIAADYRGQLVDAELVDLTGHNHPIYWRLALDSVRLEGKNQTLWIIPDSSLAHIHGNVRDAHNNHPLSGVILESQGIVDTSDNNGLFDLKIPPLLQQAEYKVNARKPGYESPSRGVTPATVPVLPILLIRTNAQ